VEADACRGNAGSRWRRWDPHVHGPGTLLNDQYTGEDAWRRYLSALEDSSPCIEAVGITDYYGFRAYERLLQEKLQGRLAQCSLIFPNVEMRLAMGTVKGAWVNLHLLVRPDDPNHVEEVRRFLSRLWFEAHSDKFMCTEAELVRLGRKAGCSGDDLAALRAGATQFKVSFDQLRDNYRASKWAQDNILIAVAGGTQDGTSGVRDASDATLRAEVEKFAHIIFASGAAQREYWLGERAADVDELRERYDGMKPCLHGSDAHGHDDVGVPHAGRYTWIKGDPTFDALWQACIDPTRAFVGAEPPTCALPSQTVSSILLQGARWLSTPKVELNPGLVAIIGARGSGKTALADVLAAGCDALPEVLSKQSFLVRAAEHLDEASVRVTWGDSEVVTRPLLVGADHDPERYPRARYLSQQFVEALCSADGMTDALLYEVQRVVFESHKVSDREGAVDFDDLLLIRGTRYRQARAREDHALATISEAIGIELEKWKAVGSYRTQVTEKEQLITRMTEDRSKLVAKGSEERLARLVQLTAAADVVRSYVRYFSQQEQQLLMLQDEVADERIRVGPERLRLGKQRHAASHISEDDWPAFLLEFKGPVDNLLNSYLSAARRSCSSWKGAEVRPESITEPLIAPDAELEKQSLSLLEAEIGRLQTLVSLDRSTAEKFVSLSKRLVEEGELLARLKDKLSDAEGAKQRAQDLVVQRQSAYERAFDAIIDEQNVLADLYQPIRTRLAASSGTLNKLSFAVVRTVDVARWASQGERLLDLRRVGPFKGKGTLQDLAEEKLAGAWRSGTAQDVGAAMQAFREAHQDALLEHSLVPKAQVAEYRAWSKLFAQWLYSTEHVAVHYTVEYDGVDIRKLSPGTRGIVLLLLYLALDDADDRPLIIDQPEENLDPRSTYEELVGLFIRAKAKRQVIIVTHNANLVINTDADQIIVAEAGPQGDGLPPITYRSGGLEDSSMRTAVCQILEGGEQAFRERARRLRVRLQR